MHVRACFHAYVCLHVIVRHIHASMPALVHRSSGVVDLANRWRGHEPTWDMFAFSWSPFSASLASRAGRCCSPMALHRAVRIGATLCSLRSSAKAVLADISLSFARVTPINPNSLRARYRVLFDRLPDRFSFSAVDDLLLVAPTRNLSAPSPALGPRIITTTNMFADTNIPDVLDEESAPGSPAPADPDMESAPPPPAPADPDMEPAPPSPAPADPDQEEGTGDGGYIDLGETSDGVLSNAHFHGGITKTVADGMSGAVAQRHPLTWVLTSVFSLLPPCPNRSKIAPHLLCQSPGSSLLSQSPGSPLAFSLTRLPTCSLTHPAPPCFLRHPAPSLLSQSSDSSLLS